MHIEVERIYEPSGKDDGTRVLVDRLWPRGVSKEEAKLDHWAKEIAPSDELRKWYDHDADKFDDFARKYRKELQGKSDDITQLLDGIDKRKRLTLLTATKAIDISHAKVLAAYLKKTR